MIPLTLKLLRGPHGLSDSDLKLICIVNFLHTEGGRNFLGASDHRSGITVKIIRTFRWVEALALRGSFVIDMSYYCLGPVHDSKSWNRCNLVSTCFSDRDLPEKTVSWGSSAHRHQRHPASVQPFHAHKFSFVHFLSDFFQAELAESDGCDASFRCYSSSVNTYALWVLRLQWNIRFFAYYQTTLLHRFFAEPPSTLDLLFHMYPDGPLNRLPIPHRSSFVLTWVVCFSKMAASSTMNSVYCWLFSSPRRVPIKWIIVKV
jgi:hypothetical protein